MKSRQDPVVSVGTGFYSTLPTLMGVLAIRYGKTYSWDGKGAVIGIGHATGVSISERPGGRPRINHLNRDALH